MIWFGDAKAVGADSFTYAGVGILSAAFLIFWRYAWRAPARALADRQPIGPALPKEVARRAALRRMSWGQFAWAGLVMVIGGARLSLNTNLLSGANRLWLIAGAGYVAVILWRMRQKLQADRFSE